MEPKEECPDQSVDLSSETFLSNGERFDASLLQKATPEYLQELLKDKKQLHTMPDSFKHVELILEKEIALVRERLFHKNGSIQKNNNDLPEPSGSMISLQRKVFVPVKENPNYNFVGRLLGPRGLTAKQMEQDLGCKIMVRGKGSMRDKRKEDQNRGKQNWEHLDEELHVLLTVEDYENRAELRLQRAVNAIQVFLDQGLKTPEDKDLLKQTQLMELAVLNDKDRQQAQVQQMTQAQQQLLLQHQYLALMNSQSAMAMQSPQNLLNPLRLHAMAGPLGSLQTAQSMLLQTASPNPTSLHPAAVSSTPLHLQGQNPFGLQQFQQTSVFPPFSSASQVNSGLPGLSPDPLAAAAAFINAANGIHSHNLDACQSSVAFSMVSPTFIQSVAGTAASTIGRSAADQQATMMREYSPQTEFDQSGNLKIKGSNSAQVRMHPYLR